MNGDDLNNLTGLGITSLDEDGDDDVEEAQTSVVDDYVESDDEDEEEQPPVTVGLVEKPKRPFSLLRQLFPSKAGGSPAWLDPINLPSGKSVFCDICNSEEPIQFLLQVYSPISGKESTFHRTVYVFMCSKMSCLFQDQHEQWKRRPAKPLRSVKVFRCQLPCSNPFYLSDPPKYDGTDKPSGPGAALCTWCGTWKGDKLCSRCKKVRYCSEKHQGWHWRSGHKEKCQLLSFSSQLPEWSSSNAVTTEVETDTVARKYQWPEYEIINEDESEYDYETSEDNNHAALVSRKNADDSMRSLLDSFEGDSDKQSFASFQQRIGKAPEQVLRYCRSASAKPLWPLSSGRPSMADIPNCCYCGGPSIFEFQIMPQLLYYFGVKNDVKDSIDWATIAVYTCAASCQSSVAYKEEFAWVQLYPPSFSC